MPELDAMDERVLRDALKAHRLLWWGSDCLECGNTTPDSMRCDVCGRRSRTRHLFIAMGEGDQ